MSQNFNDRHVIRIAQRAQLVLKSTAVLVFVVFLATVVSQDCFARQNFKKTEKSYSLAPEHWTLVDARGNELPYPETYFTKTKYGYRFTNKDIGPYVDIVLNHEFEGMFDTWIHAKPQKLSGEPFEPFEMTNIEFGAIETGSRKMVYRTDGSKGGILFCRIEQNQFDFRIRIKKNLEAIFPVRSRKFGPYKIFFRVPKGVQLINPSKTILHFHTKNSASPKNHSFAKLTPESIRPDESLLNLPLTIGKILTSLDQKRSVVLSRDHRKLVIIDNESQSIIKEVELPGSNIEFATNESALYLWSRIGNFIKKYSLDSGEELLKTDLPPEYFIRTLKAGSKYVLVTCHEVGSQLQFQLFDAKNLRKTALETNFQKEDFDGTNRQSPEELMRFAAMRFSQTIGTNTLGLQHFIAGKQPYFGFTIIEPSENQPQRRLVFLNRLTKYFNGRNLDGSLLQCWPKFPSRYLKSKMEIDFDLKLKLTNDVVSQTNIRMTGSDKGRYAPLPVSQRFFHLSNLNQLMIVPDTMSQLVFRKYDWKHEIKLAERNEWIKIIEARFPNTVVPGQTLRIPLSAISSGKKPEWELKSRSAGYQISDDAKIENGFFIWTVPKLPPQEIKMELKVSFQAQTESSRGIKATYRKSDEMRVRFNVVDPKKLSPGLRVLYDLDQANRKVFNSTIAQHNSFRFVEGKKPKAARSSKFNPNEVRKSTANGVTTTVIPSVGQFQNVCAGRDGTELFISVKDGSELKVLDLKTGAMKNPVVLPGPDILHAAGKTRLVLFSPTSQGASIHNLETKEVRKTQFDFPTEITRIAFGCSDNRFMFAVGRTKTEPAVVYAVDFEQLEKDKFIADKAISEIGEFEYAGTRTVGINVAGNGRHVVVGQQDGFSFNGTEFEKWQIAPSGLSSFRALRTGKSGRYILADHGTFETDSPIDRQREVRIADLSSDLFAVAKGGQLFIRKVGHGVSIGNIPTKVGYMTPASSAFGSRNRFFLNLKLGVAALLLSDKIYHYQFDSARFLNQALATNLEFSVPPTIEPGKPWTFPLFTEADKTKNSNPKTSIRPTKAQVLRGPAGLKFNNGKLSWDVPEYTDPIVPVLLKTQSKYENLTGFFLKTNSIDHQRNSILEFNLAGRKPLEPWSSRRQRNKNNYEAMTAFWTASEMEVGGSGEAILFSERRKKRISIADLKTGKIVHKGDTSDSEKFAVGRKYFAVNNLIKKRLRSRQIADSEELPKEIDSKYSHVAMGRTSDILFAWDNGQLDLLDASTLTRLNSANIKTPSTTAKVSQLLASDDGKKLFINTPGGKIQRLSSQPVRGVTIFELPEEARINYDGSIVVWKNQVFNADGVLLESFDEDAKAIPTDLSGCVGKLQTADKDYQITLINLETGKVFCQTSIRAIEDAGNALDWIDVQISRKRIVYISSNRKVFFIRELETDDSILGLVPTFMTRPPVRIDLGKPFVYRPSIVSAHYPLHLKLEKAPEGARFKNPSTIVWDNPTANPQEFQIRVRDVRGRESVQRFSISTN